MLRKLFHRLRAQLRRGKIEREMDAEMRFHLEMEAAENMRRGMSEEEARRAALRSFGGVERTKEAYRDISRVRWIEEFWQDLRYGSRMLLRQPGFTIVAALTLALGIGANTAIFSVVNALVFNPLPYPEPQQLVWVTNVLRGDEIIGVSDYRTYQTQTKTFDGLAAFDAGTTILTAPDESAPVNFVQATASLFPTLGVAPRLGRAFTPEEARPGGPPVIILSHEFWRRRFGGNPSVVGRSVPFGRGSRLILGVMPPGFRFLPESRVGGNVDFWEPYPINLQQELEEKDNMILANVFGRLKPGVSIEQARAELDLLNQPLIQAHPEEAGIKARVAPLAERLVGHLRRGLLMLFGTGGIVLLIACANVANLLLARANGRRQELAIRAALGAGRKRLIRQMLTESLLLAFIGGAAGLLLAMLGVKALVAGAPDNLLQLKLSRIDASVLGFTFLSVLLTVIVAGLIPALQASRIDLSESLKDGGRGVAFLTRKSARRISPALLVGELALTLVLLIGAGLLINSFLRLLAVDPGYDPKNLLTMVAGLRNPAQQKSFRRELLTRLNALPGVQGAAYSRTLPLADDGIIGKGRLTIVGRSPVPDEQKPLAESHYVSPDYFRAMRMRLRAGRGFTEQDTENTPPVVVISDTLARRYFAGEDPIGKQFLLEGSKTETELTIVGVVADVKRYGLEAETHAEIYHSSLQNVEHQGNRWVIRTAGDPLKWVPTVRQQMQEIAADVRIFQVMTMEQLLAESYAPRRFQAWLFGIFGALALVIATVGIYGVISYAVSQRTHEIGIRMALGAQASDVLRMVVWRGMSLTLVGVAIGLAVALALTRVIKSLLFNMSATDPVTFALVALLLVVIAMIASYIPARRATKVDPLIALKRE
ncbi:MAG TPA: ABC transporter permease [Blastocatellia bacterium]|jgi:putative ABC transport system permease protein|nr:ABC transporter permease [Blastocatellia bacterium]